MTRIVLAAALLAAVAGTASAMTSAADTSALRIFAPGVDASVLTADQIVAINQAIQSGDSAGEVRAFIDSIVNG